MKIDEIIQIKNRINLIEEQIQNPIENDSVIFRGDMESFGVIKVPIELPIYRTKNGRTTIAQNTLILDQNLKADAFSLGEENPIIQNFQHKILLNLSQDSKGNIYKELGYVAKQRENLLMTHEGIIVNGNRRLAAMRELYASDSIKYSTFSHIKVVILPKETTEKDIEIIEAELQLKPDTKLGYGWVERRIKLRYQLNEIKISREEIKRVYRFKREEDINIEIQQLELAEEYLSTYLDEPLNYLELSDKEQLFSDLQKSLTNIDLDESEVRRKIAFLIAKESRNLGERSYSFKDLYGNYFNQVIDIFAEENNIPLLDTVSSIKDEDLDFSDDIDNLFSDFTDEVSPFSYLIDSFDNKENTLEIAKNLIAILDSVKLQEKEKNQSMMGLQNAQNALRSLSNIEINNCDESTFDKLKGQLIAVIKKSQYLINQLDSESE